MQRAVGIFVSCYPLLRSLRFPVCAGDNAIGSESVREEEKNHLRCVKATSVRKSNCQWSNSE